MQKQQKPFIIQKLKGGKKQMNKTIIFGMIAILAMAIFASSLVLAEDNATINLSSENATVPSSGSFFWKNVGNWLTFNQEKKMNKELELAQMRLQQVDAALQRNDTKAAEKALDSYNKIMERANKRAGMLKEGSNVSLSTIKLAAMDQAILVHQARIAKIQGILNNANLTEEQRTKLEAQLSKAQNVTSHLLEVQAAKENKIKTRIMAELNMTETEADAKIRDAKDNASSRRSQFKDDWKAFKEEAKANNISVGQYAQEKRQEWRQNMGLSKSKGESENKTDNESDSDSGN